MPGSGIKHKGKTGSTSKGLTSSKCLRVKTAPPSLQNRRHVWRHCAGVSAGPKDTQAARDREEETMATASNQVIKHVMLSTELKCEKQGNTFVEGELN